MGESLFAQAVAAILTAAVAGIGSWVWNINSKVTILETKETTANLLSSAQDNSLRELLKEKFDNIDRRLTRIERAVNGRIGIEE